MGLIGTLSRQGKLPERSGARITESERTLVERTPDWQPSGNDDTSVDTPALPPASVNLTDEWDSVLDEVVPGEVTQVDVPQVRDTLVDLRSHAESALAREQEPALADTPTLLVKPLAPSHDAQPAALAEPPAPRLRTAPGPTLELRPLGPEGALPLDTPAITQATGPRRVRNRSEREALARVIAMAKPRVTPPRPRPVGRPSLYASSK